MKTKNKLKIILPLVLISSSAFVLYQIKNNSNQSTIDQSNNLINNSNSTTNNSNDELNSNIQYQKLSVISNRCRGCGKCVRIDPIHFEMRGNVAVVISSKNLDSSNLKLAINNCPATAITLE